MHLDSTNESPRTHSWQQVDTPLLEYDKAESRASAATWRSETSLCLLQKRTSRREQAHGADIDKVYSINDTTYSLIGPFSVLRKHANGSL